MRHEPHASGRYSAERGLQPVTLAASRWVAGAPARGTNLETGAPPPRCGGPDRERPPPTLSRLGRQRLTSCNFCRNFCRWLIREFRAVSDHPISWVFQWCPRGCRRASTRNRIVVLRPGWRVCWRRREPFHPRLRLVPPYRSPCRCYPPGAGEPDAIRRARWPIGRTHPDLTQVAAARLLNFSLTPHCRSR
jgi:hypothetical protein